MGQQEVYDFLMKHPDQWYTSKQISEQLAVSIGSVTMSLKKLRKTNIIKFRNTGKRNTFQYMVQSEPAKLAERKVPLIEQHAMEPAKVKIKIKPKIVHQHTYLGGQTFYGVIRPADDMNERRNEPLASSFADDDEEPMEIEATQKRKVVRRVKSTKKAKKVKKSAVTRAKAKPKKVVRKGRMVKKTTQRRAKRR